MTDNLLTPSNLRILKAIQETKSMARAAAQLKLTQSAVSRSMARLEQALGITLVDKKRNPIVLTRSGQYICSKAGDIFEKIENLAKEVESRKDRQIFDLRIGTTTSVTQNIAPYIVSDIYNEEKIFSLYNGDTAMICQMLLDGDIDIAVAAARMKSHSAIKAIPLYSEEYVIAVPSNFINIKSMDDLVRYSKITPCILTNQESCDCLQITRILRKWRIENILKLNGIWATLYMVSQGLGWCLNPPTNYLSVPDYLPGCAFLSMPQKLGNRTVYVLYKNSLYEELAKKLAIKIHRITENTILPKCRGTPFEHAIQLIS